MSQDPKTSIVFTNAAAQKVQNLIDEEEADPKAIDDNGPNRLKLRAYIQGGGCSGFQYGFTFDNTINEDDHIICKTVQNRPVKLLIDSMSYMYLHGAEIDYQDEVSGQQFIIRNIKADATCGCGASFSPPSEEESDETTETDS